MNAAGKIKDAGVTLRAVFLALLLIPLNNYWITVIEVRWYALDGTCLPIFITPVFILFVIALLNKTVAKTFPSFALRRGELLTVYMMIVMGATLASHDLVQNMFGAIPHPFYKANDVNQYSTLFLKHLPKQLFITDPYALERFYKGYPNPWEWQIIRAWILPLAIWGGFLIVLISMMMCINILIRKQWTENEKLVFPLVQLPIAMAAEDSDEKFYKNKFMWAGFALAAFIGLINGLHTLYPSMPWFSAIKQFNIGAGLSARPWNAMNVGGSGFQIASYPFAIGIGYFIPLDLSFSCWFFYIARKLVQVLGAAMGWDTGGNAAFPYYESQSSGAWLALGVIIIIGTIPYLKTVWNQAWHESGTAEEKSEAKLYRLAFYGIAAGWIILMLFSMVIGMSAWVALIFFVIYFIISITITRVRAELGTPHEIYFVNPQQIMLSLFGYERIGVVNLTMLQSFYWFNRGYRSHPMPNQLESFKMADGTAIKTKPLIFALMLAVVVGLVTAYYANINVTYQAGAQAKCLGYKWWLGTESFDRLRDWTVNQPKVDATRILAMLIGVVIVVALKLLRGAFIAWPFHPAGYALAVSYAMDYFWFAFFLSWMIKSIIIRYGGMKLHNTFVPFFLGLILGDFFIGSVWAIVGPLIGTQCYRVFI